MCSIQKDHTFSAFTQFGLEMFDNYVSESNADNHIYLEFNVQSFVKALSSTKTTKTVYMKLSRYRGTPSLVFDMETLEGINIRQDISVKVLQPQEFSIYEEPNTVPPFLKLLVQKAKELRSVLSRMKIIDDAICIEANNQGILNISSSNVTVYMETTFSSVLPVDTDTTTDVSVKMKVEVKSLMKALSSIVIEPRAINFCFNDAALMIYVIMKGGVGNITYFIPGRLFEDSLVC